uniref:Uncharacterized protein n=1 Tax=Tolypothrix bouteillei VB521301 TaxID=1479485 RepID=A0A0C1RMT6_9CYAN
MPGNSFYRDAPWRVFNISNKSKDYFLQFIEQYCIYVKTLPIKNFVIDKFEGEHLVLAKCPQNRILGLYKQSPPTWTFY